MIALEWTYRVTISGDHLLRRCSQSPIDNKRLKADRPEVSELNWNQQVYDVPVNASSTGNMRMRCCTQELET